MARLICGCKAFKFIASFLRRLDCVLQIRLTLRCLSHFGEQVIYLQMSMNRLAIFETIHPCQRQRRIPHSAEMKARA